MDKISFYNISVPFEGYSLLYNTRSHRDRYVGSLVYRESVVPVPMIREDKYCIKGCKNQDVRLSKAYLTS